MASVFEREINWQALRDFTDLDKPTQSHLKNVYASLALSIFAAALGALTFVQFHFLWSETFMLLSFLASIGLVVLLGMTHKPQGGATVERFGYLAAFGFLTGITSGPLIAVVASIDPAIVTSAFLQTTVLFGLLSVLALVNKSRSFLFLMGFLGSGLSLLCMAGLLNLFLGSLILFKFQLYFGLLIFVGFVMFDTQLIIFKFKSGDHDFIWHSVDLFLDFIAIMKRLMIIFAGDKKERKNN